MKTPAGSLLRSMSEFRQDLVSGDWIVVATGRGKRPHQFKARRRKKVPQKGCPFENPREASGGGILLSLPDEEHWTLQVIPNKYPAVSKNGVWILDRDQRGPFYVLPGYGYHEVVITKDHNTFFPDLSSEEGFMVFLAFQQRYKNLIEDNNIAYVHIFANVGETAGASMYHPHYQILAIPIIPPDVRRSLDGSEAYSKKYGTCVHCTQIAWEIKQGKRIIFETDEAVVFAPYVSKEPFEMRVFPKEHRPFFEDADKAELKSISHALQVALQKLKSALSDPDYNFFIHTTPFSKRKRYSHYHWHIEIFPRTNISAGFELGTSVEVNPMDPDEAAKLLRNS